MKQIPCDYKERDGFKMLKIVSAMDFRHLDISVIKQKVSCNSSLAPDPRCDFILGGSSVCEDRVYEINSLNKGRISRIGRDPVFSHFCYCLPENEKEVVAKMKKQLIEAARDEVVLMKDMIKRYENLLEKVG